MKLNPFVKAGIGLTFALLWSCPTLAALTEAKNFGLEVKATAQSEDDRDLGTQKGGDVNGIGLDLRPWIYGESGDVERLRHGPGGGVERHHRDRHPATIGR